MNYQLVKKALNFETAIRWLMPDSTDDFFQDQIYWADLKTFPSEFLEKRKHRFLQIDTIAHWKEYIPKKSGMLREAVWLHPVHRVLYLAILHRLLPKLDPKIYPEVYSYRLDTPNDPDAYPFTKKMERWKNFNNDFRQSALDESTNAILVTDLASYFDHINCDQMGRRLKGLLGSTIDEADNEIVDLLVVLLKLWGDDGFGMPHNLDASSFFGSLYLHPVDDSMVSARFRYFRWIDDIRVTAKSREQAIRALHHLQRELAKYRLFLATDKTKIIEKGSSEFEELLNVDDDIFIAEAEETITSGAQEKIELIVDRLFERLEFHARPQGDDRKFRAFANRLLDAGDYSEIKKNIHDRLHDFVIPRLKTHPERSDYWAKILSSHPTEKVSNAIHELLVKKASIFDWQRFYLWKLALHLPAEFVSNELIENAKSVSHSDPSENVRAQAIIFLGKNVDSTERESIFARLFSPQKSYVVQRAVLIAIQELIVDIRSHYYQRALDTNSDHKELIDYLTNNCKTNYGLKIRSSKKCLVIPRKATHVIKRGIGLYKGKPTRFRLIRDDYDYE